MELDALSIIIGLITGSLFKVPFLYHWYRKAARDKEEARRLLVAVMSVEDRLGSRVEDENEIVGEPI